MAHANDNPLRHEMFNHFDTNKDGFLQKHEFVYANFLAMDHNGLYDDANNNCKNITTNSSQFVVLLVLMYFLLEGDNQVSRHDFDHYYTNVRILPVK